MLTHNNYFTTSGNGKSWTVNIGKCTNKHIEDFHSECLRSAKLIYETATSPITLLFSGGLDSEFMIRVFTKSKVPFNTAILSYGEYNVHDTKYAIDYCNSHGINPTIVDIDIKDFIESGKILDIANQAKCAAYQMPSVMYGLTKLDGTLVMANGEPYLKNYDGIWKYQETEHVNSYMGWYEQNAIDGTPDFLRYTAETTLSFLLEERVRELVNNQHPGKLSTRTSKHLIYSKNYTFVPRQKYTGFEKIEQGDLFNHPVFNEIKKLKDIYGGVFEIEYKDLISILN
jgi:hypothetical protein